MAVRTSGRLRSAVRNTNQIEEAIHALTVVGSHVEVYWSDDELRGTDWESGWDRAEVQSYDEDMIHVMHDKEKARLYKMWGW